MNPDVTDLRGSTRRRELLTSTWRYLSADFGDSEAASFWKRGSFRSGSNIGSSRSSARVSGTFAALSGLSYGVESSFCKASTARSGSPIFADTRARISIEPGPSIGSFSIGFTAIAFGLEGSCLIDERVDVVRCDIENLIKLSQRFGETTQALVGKRVLDE